MSLSETILVTDGEQRAALAVVRSLGRIGYRVMVCSSVRHSLSGASRHCRRSSLVPDALDDPRAYARSVQRLAREWDIEITIPITEASLLAVRDELPGVTVPFPTTDRFRAICDKRAVLSKAASLGLSVPQQTLLLGPTVGDDAALDALGYPVVLKPSRSVVDEAVGRSKVAVSYARDRSDLTRQLASLPASAYPLLVQERIVGTGEGVFLLRWDGQVVAAFAHRRIREKPPAGGVSVYRESVPLDSELLRQSQQLLEAFDWQGVAMVEFKRDSESGKAYLMEVNGRFWGSLQLAIDAGVDFPALLLDAALGVKHPPVLTYRTGVRSRWWWGDVDHLLARLRGSPEELWLPLGSRGRARALAAFLVLWRRGDRSEVLRLTDPRPFLRESVDWVSGSLGTRQ